MAVKAHNHVWSMSGPEESLAGNPEGPSVHPVCFMSWSLSSFGHTAMHSVDSLVKLWKNVIRYVHVIPFAMFMALC